MALMQDGATQGIRDMPGLGVQPPKDFNGDILTTGDHVLFAWSRGQLAEGHVTETHEHPGAVTIRSMRDTGRSITVDAEGVIKVAV